jgi:hypothetical protein
MRFEAGQLDVERNVTYNYHPGIKAEQKIHDYCLLWLPPTVLN